MFKMKMAWPLLYVYYQRSITSFRAKRRTHETNAIKRNSTILEVIDAKMFMLSRTTGLKVEYPKTLFKGKEVVSGEVN